MVFCFGVIFDSFPYLQEERRFVQFLTKLGCHDFKPESVASAFSDPTARPMLTWIMSNLSAANVLSEEECCSLGESTKAEHASDHSLNQQLDRLETQKLQDEFKIFESRKRRLQHQRDHIRGYLSGIEAQAQQAVAAKPAFRELQEKAQANAQAQIDTTLESYRQLSRICCTLGAWSSSGDLTTPSASPFHSTLLLEEYEAADLDFTRTLNHFVKKQFHSGSAEHDQDEAEAGASPSLNNRSNLLHAESEDTVTLYQTELSRLKHIYPLGVRQRIGSSVQLSIAEQSLAAAEQQESRQERYFGNEALNISLQNLNLRVEDLDAEISECRANRQHTTTQVLPLMLQRLGELQEATILRGDFAFKTARQDYYLEKQKTMMKHLVLQQARHCFLSALIKEEALTQQKTRQLLSVLSTELDTISSEIDTRQDDYERLSSTPTLDERTTIDQRDNFSWMLHQMLGGEQPEGSFVSTSHINQSVELLRQANEQRTVAAETTDKSFEITLEQIEACVSAAYLVSDDTKGGNVPKEFGPEMSQLETTCVRVRDEVSKLVHQHQMLKEPSLLNTSKDKFKEQMFVQLFTDPEKCIERMEVSSSVTA